MYSMGGRRDVAIIQTIGSRNRAGRKPRPAPGCAIDLFTDRDSLHRYQADEAERHRAGYRKTPPAKPEFDIPEEDHAWGGGSWKDE